MFDSRKDQTISSFVHFPLDTTKLTGLCDSNWGPQDQSRPKPNQKYTDLDLFRTRSLSGHFIILHGPLHWISKRQKTTARSSTEAEIYVTDSCVKDLLQIRLILQDLGLEKLFIKDKIPIYNDNMACVQWSKNKTSKGLRHVQIKENGVRENKHLVDIQHCEGKTNLSDLMTKEDKNATHYISIRDKTTPPPFSANHTQIQKKIVSFNQNVNIQTFSKHLSSDHIQRIYDKSPVEYNQNHWKCTYANNIATRK